MKYISHLKPSIAYHYFLAHKIIGTIVIIVILVSGYKTYSYFTASDTTPRYVLANATKDTLITSVSGTGQVSAANQIDLKSKSSGDVIYIGGKGGDSVEAGTVIVQLDNRSVARDLESGQIALAKLTKPADPEDIEIAEQAVAKSYDDTHQAISETFADLPAIADGLRDLYYSHDGYLNDQNISRDNASLFDSNSTFYKAKVKGSLSLDKARNNYQTNLETYNQLADTTDPAKIKQMVNTTYILTGQFVNALKDAQSALAILKNYQTTPTTAQTNAINNVSGWLSTLNSDLSSLQSARDAITQKELDLVDLKKGADPLDIRSEQLSLAAKQDAYNDSYIRAPFAGLIAKLNVHEGDSLSSGTSIATFITKQKVAEVSLNEVDIAKVKTGQKVNLTFDAIDGLTITGEVIEVDLVGTVTQGVVDYSVKIGFDTDDDRVKPGMSVTASIITGIKSDVLVIPTSAIKSAGGSSYVELFNPPLASTSTPSGLTTTQTPIKQPVEVGSAGDSETEIVSGLKLGDQIISRTITSATKTTTTQTPSLFGGGGNRNFGGGATRTTGR